MIRTRIQDAAVTCAWVRESATVYEKEMVLRPDARVARAAGNAVTAMGPEASEGRTKCWTEAPVGPI